MRTPRFAIAGLVLLLVGGLAFAGQWFARESAADNTPRACVGLLEPGPQPQPQPAQPQPEEATELAGPPVAEHEAPELQADPVAEDKPDVQPPAVQKPEIAPPKDMSDKEAIRIELEKMIEEVSNIQPYETTDFTFTVSGRVIDDSGVGVPGAEVWASATYTAPLADDATTAGKRLSRTRTIRVPTVVLGDNAGYFSALLTVPVAKEVASINVSMNATAPKFAHNPQPTQLSGVKAGDTRDNIEIKMFAGGSISGRVVDAHNAPLHGVTIQAVEQIKQDRTSRRRVASSNPAAVRTDKDGRFTIASVKAGTWSLTAHAPYHLASQTPTGILVTAGCDVTAPDVVMNAAASIKLRVLDDSGAPLSTGAKSGTYVTVYIKLAGGKTIALSGRLDAQGYATVQRVPADALEATVRASGWESEYPVSLRLTGGAENDIGDVRMKKAEVTEKLRRGGLRED